MNRPKNRQALAYWLFKTKTFTTASRTSKKYKIISVSLVLILAYFFLYLRLPVVSCSSGITISAEKNNIIFSHNLKILAFSDEISLSTLTLDRITASAIVANPQLCSPNLNSKECYQLSPHTLFNQKISKGDILNICYIKAKETLYTQVIQLFHKNNTNEY